MDSLNIGELAKNVGVNTSATRYYESIGLLPKPPRQSGWRKYDLSILDRLKVIHAAREFGFTLEEIQLLLDGFPKTAEPSIRWQKLAKKKLPELNELIERARALTFLIEAGLDCERKDFALCIKKEGKA